MTRPSILPKNMTSFTQLWGKDLGRVTGENVSKSFQDSRSEQKCQKISVTAKNKNVKMQETDLGQ